MKFFKLLLLISIIVLAIGCAGTDPVTPEDQNRKPIANAGSDITVKIGETVNLNGALSSDPDSDVITYVWSFTSKPAGSVSSLGNADTVTNASFVPDKEGQYVVSLIVNDGKLDSEVDTVIITVNLYNPDLTPYGLSCNVTEVLQNELIQIISSISNIWKGASGSFRLAYYLSSDTIITTSDTFLGYAGFASLLSNETVSLITNLTVSDSVFAGNYYVGVIADYQNTITEEDENNNTAYVVSQLEVIAPTKNIVNESFSAPASVISGQSSVLVPYSLTNTGNTATGNFRVGVYLSEDSTITTGDTLIGNTTISLGALSSTSGNISSTIPYSTSKKTYYIGIIADDQNAVTESNEGDNTQLSSSDTEITPQNVDWVVMVYIAADNSLSSYGATDINEMKAANLGGQKVRVITLIDQNTSADTYLYEVFNGKTVQLASTELALNASGSGELNTGDPANLSKFIEYVTNNYEATNYSLVIWNHGGGWRSATRTISGTKSFSFKTKPVKSDTSSPLTKDISWDDTSGSFLGNDDVQNVLQNKGISLLCMDACFMGMVETAYELRKSVTGSDYLVFSENTEPAGGYPYTTILNHFLAASDTSAINFATIIVNDYVNSYGASTGVTQSAIDLSKIGQVVSDLNNFVTFLGGQSQSSLDTARQNVESYDSIYYSEFVDLWDLADQFVDASATTLKNSISTAVIANASRSGKPNAKGLSINFPLYGYDTTYIDSNNTRNIDFLVDSTWDNFLEGKAFVDPHEPSDNSLGGAIVNNGYSGSAYTGNAYDDDIYTLTVTAGGSISVSLTSVPSNGDLDIYLLNAALTQVASSDSGTLGISEFINYSGATVQTYYLVVTYYQPWYFPYFNISDPYDIA
ncbi:MAG: hypothetical protein KAS64_06190, partial [Spirochaetes bacterium]|nr:hypothetical protein [Spirochaetota bacterium]